MKTRNAAAKSTPFEIARHIVSQAHRERVRLRRLGYVVPRAYPAPGAREASPHLRVVVGVDGSDGSRRALAWAAREAQAHDGRLTVCWTGPAPASPPATGAGEVASAQGSLDRIEDEILTTVAEAAPELEAEVRMVPAVIGAKPDELAELARSADLVVVAHPYERLLSRPALSPARRMINHAECPVMLVP